MFTAEHQKPRNKVSFTVEISDGNAGFGYTVAIHVGANSLGEKAGAPPENLSRRGGEAHETFSCRVTSGCCDLGGAERMGRSYLRSNAWQLFAAS